MTANNLRGAGANKYAEQHTMTGGYNTEVISNSNIAGATSVIVASIVTAAGVNYIKEIVATAGQVTLYADGSNTWTSGDVVNYIVVNP